MKKLSKRCKTNIQCSATRPESRDRLCGLLLSLTSRLRFAPARFRGKKVGFSKEGSGFSANTRKACLGTLKDSSSSGVRGSRIDVGGVNRLVGLYWIDFGGKGGGGCDGLEATDEDMEVEEMGSLRMLAIWGRVSVGEMGGFELLASTSRNASYPRGIVGRWVFLAFRSFLAALYTRKR